MKKLLSLMLALSLMLTLLPAAQAASGMANFTEQNTYTASTFTDVPANEWYTDNVRRAYELGLMQGKDGGRFDPDGQVTVEEVVAIAARLHALYTTGEANFPTDGDPWYEPYGQYLREHELVKVYHKYNVTPYDYSDDPNAEERPGDPASRIFFACMLASTLPESEFPAINDIADDALPDINTSAPYHDLIYRFYRAGVLSGSDVHGRFQPYTYITRKEVAAILTRITDVSLRRTFTLEPMESATDVCGAEYLDWDDQYGLLIVTGDNLHFTFTFATGELRITGEGAMSGYQPWGLLASKIRRVVIEPGVTTIGDKAFSGCDNLTEVVIPDTVTTVGHSAFQNCTALERITLPDSITEMGHLDFAGCTALTEIQLPQNLKTITIDKFRTGHFFKGCTGLTSVTLPETLEYLPNGMFSGCTNLQSLTVSSRLQVIYDEAFTGCGQLTAVTVPSDVKLSDNALKDWNGELVKQ